MVTKLLKIMPLMALASSLVFTSCEKSNDDKPTADAPAFAYGAESESSFYITTFGEIPETGSLTSDFSHAATLISGHLCMAKYGDYIYANSGAMGDGNGGEQTLHKYAINEDEGLTEIAELTFANSPSVIEIIFASETKAYACCYKTGSLIIFNPSTMQQTGTLDLSSYAASGNVWGYTETVPADGNPDAGNGIIVDGKLYLPLNQFNGGMTTWQPLDVDGQIAIIDVATDKVDKVITTPDVKVLGMAGHTTPIVFGDYIYFCSGPFAAMFGMPDGFVRVNKNTQEFDGSYHIAFSDLDGAEKGSYCMQMSGANGKLYFMMYKESLKSNDDSEDYVNNKVNVPYELDVQTGKGKMLDLPATSSWSAQASLTKDDYVLFGLHALAGSGFYRYYPSTGECDAVPTVVTPCGAYKIIDLED